MNKSPTPEQIENALIKMKEYLSAGWSMPYSRVMACGSDSHRLSVAVRRTPEYLELLNQYESRRPSGSYYNRDKRGNLKACGKINGKPPTQ